MDTTVFWPEPFMRGKVTETNNHALCAHALMAWANVMSQNKPPDCFGVVMAEIAHKLGISGKPESFMQWSQEHPL